jgi:hypothetical protein
VHFARLLATHNRFRPPAENFVVDPGGIRLRSATAHLEGRPAEVLKVPVEVRNGSRTWLSSEFQYQPVNLAYRWYDDDGNLSVSEGHRTGFARPLGPGDSANLEVTVQMPGVPGAYELSLTVVQEHFAWLDEIDRRCSARLPAKVTAAS